jgi:hypothetical protein
VKRWINKSKLSGVLVAYIAPDTLSYSAFQGKGLTVLQLQYNAFEGYQYLFP